ncbi:MAG: RluA family pseudouridine synthase [Saprospiraceae bacterium]|jgi:23S rRNA pseudouridine1911/1915/1917 synthase|nr:RluA family pseudouridine synthase [Saprospiraceae bacterium]MBL0026625.1 RluA family pseudouridine synthase [Saprospiraceae bacterium]
MASIKSMDLEPSDELYEHQRIKCDPKQALIRIDKFLIDKLEKVSRNRIQNAIKIGCILVNNGEIKSNYKVKPGDEISLVLPSDPNEESAMSPEDIPLDILYEDNHIMVINKPAGMVVHPGTGNNSGTLVNALLYHFQHHTLPLLKGNKEDRPGLVHRIDKDTSGLILIAKSDYAMTHLAKQFFDHTIEREYIALVWGDVDAPSGTITGNIGRHEKDRRQMSVFHDEERGKHAVTHYEVIEKLYYVTLLKCHLETGRTHQIRVHMKHAGHTLFNDLRYGGDRILKGTIFSKYKQFVDNCMVIMPRQALHARSLGFIHPETLEKMYFESNLPSDFADVLVKWRGYVSSRKDLMIED